MPTLRLRRLLAAGVTAVAVSASAACAGGADAARDPNALTVYNAQHAELMQLMVDRFTKETGITVALRNGSDFELANQLNQEGARSPADVFVTENSPAMTLVDQGGNLAPVEKATLSQVPARYRPGDGDWIGFAARSTVLVYNTAAFDDGPTRQLPGSILELAEPQWKDRVGIAAAGADFQAVVTAVIALHGEAKALAWLKGLKTNAKTYRGNIAIMQAVNRGELDAGVIYHYYWHKDQAEAGQNSNGTSLHFFADQDAGGFVSVSGAGVVKSSRKAAQAQRFLAFLVSEPGQRILSESKALEYPVREGVPADAQLKPLAELDPPTVDLARLNGLTTVTLMQQAGLL